MWLLRALFFVTVTAALLAGCGSRVVKPTTEETPGETTWRPPASPEAAVDSLGAIWIRRDIEAYEQLFTADFVFRRAMNDTGPWRQIHRDQELIAADALFNGAPGRPAAISIEIVRTALVSGPDLRPGKLPTWHRRVTADYDLTIETPSTLYRVFTRVAFFAVRGDSAILPEGLDATRDSTRWWLDRWEELGPIPVPGAPAPSGETPTWARIKQIYLGPPPPPPIPMASIGARRETRSR